MITELEIQDLRDLCQTRLAGSKCANLIVRLAIVLLLAALPAYAQYTGNAALSFNGSNYVSVTNFGAIAPTTEVTVEFWANANALGSSAAFMLEPDQYTNAFHVRVAYISDQVIWEFGDTTSGGFLSETSPTATVSNWTHFAFVVSTVGHYMRIYRNGVLDTQRTGLTPPFVPGNYELRIGGNYSGGNGYFFKGRLDEFRLWNRARSQAEIRAARTNTLDGSESNLVLYYRFDDSGGTVATNSATATGAPYNGRLVNGSVWTNSAAPIFAAPPTVTTLTVNEVTANAATLNGRVNPQGAETEFYFQYGPSLSYGGVTIVSNLAAGTTPIAVSGAISGLLPGTPYHYNIVATNSGGTTAGSDLTFTTLAAAPVVVTQPATDVLPSSATLNGTVNAGGAATAFYFQYGATTNYGSVTATTMLAATNFTFSVSHSLAGLPSASSYHFRLVAANSVGTNFGADLTFRTGGATNLVLNINDNGAGSLREAIAGSVPGDLVRFATNLSGQTVMLTSGQLLLSKHLTIDAAALPGGLVLSGNTNSRILFITNNVTVVINSLMLTSGQVSFGVGGGIYVSTNCTLAVSNCLLSGNSATGEGSDGGGIYNEGVVTVSQSTFAGNYATSFGGGIFNSFAGTLTLDYCVFADNSAAGGGGGGIYNLATATLSRCTLSGNSASGEGSGGGINNEGMLKASPLADNYAASLGGGIFNSLAAILTLNECVFADNSAAGGGGGGIYNLATATLSRCTLAGNSAAGVFGGFGGGILSAGTLTLDQTTLSRNSAIGSTNGGGLGGGVYNLGTNFLRNCLIALNSGGISPDAFGNYSSRGHNLLGVTDGSTGLINGVNEDRVGTAAAPFNHLLGPLMDNGGPTLTMSLLPGSPAIDAGDDSVTNSFDQRGVGFPRLRGQHVDIGAFEFDASAYSAPSIVLQNAGDTTLDQSTHLGSLPLSASVNPNGLSAIVRLEYGVATTYGNATASLLLGPATTNVALSLSLTGLAPGLTWHYRVVAASAAGTTFGPDQTINISVPGDFNGNGVVDQSELDTVYAGYLPTSLWLFMTNVAGLGGTNVTFALSNATAGAYSVEYTTNLADWLPLGHATPRYLFTDTNAPTLPQRYYRLRYP